MIGIAAFPASSVPAAADVDGVATIKTDVAAQTKSNAFVEVIIQFAD